VSGVAHGVLLAFGRIGVIAHLDHGGRIRGSRNDRDVAKLVDLQDVADVAAPLILGDAHPPARGPQVPALDRLDDVLAAARRVHAPVQPVVTVLQLEGAGVPADRDAGVIDGRDEVVEVRAPERRRLDDLPPAAHVAALGAVGDTAAQALAVDADGLAAFFELAGCGPVHCWPSGGRSSSSRTSWRWSQPVSVFSARV
jgi:hypothetical protein